MRLARKKGVKKGERFVINDTMKILRINTYIQRDKGMVRLDGKTVICVAFDHTCACEQADEEVVLTDEQVDNLFNQTLGLIATEGN